MADKKISALTSATTPLAGTEVLPIVQGGATVKTPVSALVTNQPIAATTLSASGNTTFLGNIVAPLSDTPRSTDNTKEWMVVDSGYIGFRQGTDHSFNIDTYNGGGYPNAVKIYQSGNVQATVGNVIVGTAGKGIDFSANANAPGMTSELLNWYEEGAWTPTDNSTAGLTFSVAYAKYTRIGRAIFINAFITYPATADVNNAAIGGLPFIVDGANYPPFTVVTNSGTAIAAVANATASDFIFTSISNYTTKIVNSTLSAKGVLISGCYFTS